jgi:hypothetical protein
MWIEYFILVGTLFLIYCLVRFLFWLETDGFDHPLPPESNSVQEPANPIDTSPLSTSVQRAREDYQAAIQNRTPPSERALRLKSRREELAQLPFFHKPPRPAPPTEVPPVLTLLLV